MNVFEIHPEVWTCESWPPMLVCSFRRWEGKPVIGAKNPTTVERLEHPVAIQLTVPPVICFGFKGGEDTAHEVWTRHDPEKIGIPARAATLALAEAFRCVTAGKDLSTCHIEAKFSVKKLDERSGAIRRNILIWLSWGHWQATGKTFEERRADVESLGFTLSAKAFQRVLENAGMTI